MSMSDWRQQQLIGMAAMMQRLGLDSRGKTPCRGSPAAVIDVCRGCASRGACRSWLTPEDIVPNARPVICPRADRLAELMADLESFMPPSTRH